MHWQRLSLKLLMAKVDRSLLATWGCGKNKFTRK
jgi:hypothetical protein